MQLKIQHAILNSNRKGAFDPYKKSGWKRSEDLGQALRSGAPLKVLFITTFNGSSSGALPPRNVNGYKSTIIQLLLLPFLRVLKNGALEPIY